MAKDVKVVLNGEMQAAIKKFEDYRSVLKSNQDELETIIANLKKGFTGEAADGFIEFYDSKVKPVFLKDDGILEKHLAVFDKKDTGLLYRIEQALVVGDGVDPKLAEKNRNAGTEKKTVE